MPKLPKFLCPALILPFFPHPCAGCALFENLITIMWSEGWRSETAKDELGIVTLPDDDCLTVRGFGAACQTLTWSWLYVNALDACVPAEGIWSLEPSSWQERGAKEVWHQPAGPSNRTESGGKLCSWISFFPLQTPHFSRVSGCRTSLSTPSQGLIT